ncbi:MAG: hypothetical protein IAE79_09710 [Anaerolinea sp.]|nr:hypothetical protein [Anaerolinea sp.]
MLQLRKISLVGLVFVYWLWVGLWQVMAQTPRPTPTIDPGIDATSTPSPTPTIDPGIDATSTPSPTPDARYTPTPVVVPTVSPPPPAGQSPSGGLGTIRGLVYQDSNGDGKCINTGTAGEGPVAGITVEFVSSDEQTVINLQTGPDGIYGLTAAGYSYWAVSARPGSAWVVTSEKTRYVPIFEDSLVATDVNFCVQKAGAATVLLPASGAFVGTFWLTLALAVGIFLIGLGMRLQHHFRASGTR